MGIGLLQPGCNCLLKFEPTTACTGLLTWCSAASSKTLVQRKSVSGSTWETVATVTTGSPATYAVDYTQNGRVYRVICEACPGKGVISNEITIQLCTHHSWWWRFARENCTYTEGCPHTCSITLGERDCNGVQITNPQLSKGACVICGTSPNKKLYSRSYTNSLTRAGYTFDYRFFGYVVHPGCGADSSGAVSAIFPNLTTTSLGRCEYITTYTESWSLLAVESGGAWVAPPTPESGSFSWEWTVGIDVAVWLNLGGVTWPDGSFMGGGHNTYGLLFSNEESTVVQSGSATPCTTYPPITSWPPAGPHYPARQVATFAASQGASRTCQQWIDGVNELPPPPAAIIPCHPLNYPFPYSGPEWRTSIP